MMCFIKVSQVVNALGLFIDICGAYLMFSNTPKVTSQTYVYNQSEMTELRRRDQVKNKRIRLGMILLAIGFTLQLAGMFLQ
jgi:hypothetical protein